MSGSSLARAQGTSGMQKAAASSRNLLLCARPSVGRGSGCPWQRARWWGNVLGVAGRWPLAAAGKSVQIAEKQAGPEAAGQRRKWKLQQGSGEAAQYVSCLGPAFN